ncbi:putative nuclease HARBI1 isoform X1 [Photinus pyralis]|uniref:putative nuclease HARBI1 isoform X1 n=1 Tax=Photinus pyralis TaxID=7054 RepID=UPI0012676376|nr:putative nuclease HARBI1 isoform X1 [Photinus pyralis]
MELIDVDDVDVVDMVDIVENIRIPRQIHIRRNLFNIYSNVEFFRRFRLEKGTALYLLEKIEHRLEYFHNRNNSISPMNQLLLTLRAYASAGHFVAVGDFVHADKSTVCKIVSKVSRLIASIAREFIYMPRNEVEIASAQNKFYDIAGFPRVIGAIDGCHIKIQSQGGADAEIYRNRKGYFSVNVQAVTSADLLFQDIVARWPGSTHDTTIFRNSRLMHRFNNGDFGNSILLGDSGYMNLSYLFTPFLNVQNDGERNYNRSHVQSRVKVENLFGVWKRRFPIIAYGCRMKLENVLCVTVATAVLHNLARLRGEPEPPIENLIMEHELQQAIRDGDIPLAAEENDLGYDYRRHLVDIYFSRL